MKTDTFENITYLQDVIGSKLFSIPLTIYCVDGLLIDTGPEKNWKKYQPFFNSLSFDQVAITHLHEDHAGLARFLQKGRELPIYVHESAVEEAGQNSTAPLHRKIFWGNRRAFRPTLYPELVQTQNHTFEVIDAPGHRMDHVVLWEKKKGWLFTGDLFVSSRIQVAFKDENMNLMIQSLEKIMALDFDIMFCGHSGIRKGGKRLIGRKLDFLYTTREKIRKLKSQGFSDRRITSMLFPGFKLMPLITFGDWSSENIVKTLY